MRVLKSLSTKRTSREEYIRSLAPVMNGTSAHIPPKELLSNSSPVKTIPVKTWNGCTPFTAGNKLGKPSYGFKGHTHSAESRLKISNSMKAQ